jgi:hypothetical protein
VVSVVVVEWATLVAGAADTQAVRVVPTTLNIQVAGAVVLIMQDPTRITVLQRAQDMEKSLLGY